MKVTKVYLKKLIKETVERELSDKDIDDTMSMFSDKTSQQPKDISERFKIIQDAMNLCEQEIQKIFNKVDNKSRNSLYEIIGLLDSMKAEISNIKTQMKK